MKIKHNNWQNQNNRNGIQRVFIIFVKVTSNIRIALLRILFDPFSPYFFKLLSIIRSIKRSKCFINLLNKTYIFDFWIEEVSRPGYPLEYFTPSSSSLKFYVSSEPIINSRKMEVYQITTIVFIQEWIFI